MLQSLGWLLGGYIFPTPKGTKGSLSCRPTTGKRSINDLRSLEPAKIVV